MPEDKKKREILGGKTQILPHIIKGNKKKPTTIQDVAKPLPNTVRKGESQSSVIEGAEKYSWPRKSKQKNLK